MASRMQMGLCLCRHLHRRPPRSVGEADSRYHADSPIEHLWGKWGHTDPPFELEPASYPPNHKVWGSLCSDSHIHSSQEVGTPTPLKTCCSVTEARHEGSWSAKFHL